MKNFRYNYMKLPKHWQLSDKSQNMFQERYRLMKAVKDINSYLVQTCVL
jgi:hypothetical protein